MADTGWPPSRTVTEWATGRACTETDKTACLDGAAAGWFESGATGYASAGRCLRRSGEAMSARHAVLPAVTVRPSRTRCESMAGPGRLARPRIHDFKFIIFSLGPGGGNVTAGPDKAGPGSQDSKPRNGHQRPRDLPALGHGIGFGGCCGLRSGG